MLHSFSTELNEAVFGAAAKSLQLCPHRHVPLCDPIDGSPPGSSVPGILQARTLEWVAISFSNAWKWKVKVKLLSLVQLLATPWTAAHQAPLSMGFSRQAYWSGVPSTSVLNVYEVLFLVMYGDSNRIGEKIVYYSQFLRERGITWHWEPHRRMLSPVKNRKKSMGISEKPLLWFLWEEMGGAG